MIGMIQMIKNVKVLLGAVALLAAGFSQAAPVTVDVADVVATITGGVAVVSSIGVAGLSIAVVIKLFKWVRGAL